jgi:hypothetical protein
MKKSEKKLLKQGFKQFIEILESELKNEKQFTNETFVSGNIPIRKGKYEVIIEFKKSPSTIEDRIGKEFYKKATEAILANKKLIDSQSFKERHSSTFDILRKHFENIAPIITFGSDFGQGFTNGKEELLHSVRIPYVKEEFPKGSINKPYDNESLNHYAHPHYISQLANGEDKPTKSQCIVAINLLINDMAEKREYPNEKLFELRTFLNHYNSYI